MSEADTVEAVVRARLSLVLDASQTAVTACAAWVGVYAAVAPGAITAVWASLLADPSSDTDRRVGLLAVMNEALKNCARRSGSDDVIRQFLLAVRRDVPGAITTALSLEPQEGGGEFRRCAYQALRVWKGFAGFLPTVWIDRTVTQLAATEAARAGGASGAGQDGAGANASGAGAGAAAAASSSAGGAGGGGAHGLSGLDALAAESSDLAQVLRFFQKYNAALQRLQRFETDQSTSTAAIESVRDEVLHRAQSLLNALGTPDGKTGFIPRIQAEVRTIQQKQQQSANSAAGDDAEIDPLAGFF